MKKSIPIIAASVIVVIIVGYFIFQYTVKTITEREVKRITREQTGRITDKETDKITKKEIDRITEQEIARITEERTKQITEEITNKMFGGDVAGGDGQLKEAVCDKTPAKRQFNSEPYYNGPLIDEHLHMPFTFNVPSAIYAEAEFDAPILEEEVEAAGIICVFDRGKTNSAFGFYVMPNLLKGQAVQLIKKVEQQYKGRIVPFLMPAHVSGLDFDADVAEEILNSNKGLFKGIGEIAFYKGSYKGVSPDDPKMLQIYKVAEKHKLAVMIHPDKGQQQIIEKIVKENPNVRFLFHGDEIEQFIAGIMDRHPNAYYSVDTQLYDIPNEHTIASLYGAKNKEEFISELTANFDKILKINLDIWKPRIEKHPDRFLWGTDRAFDWHFDPEVGDIIDEMSRSFIGQLKPEVQEKFAYGNAEEMLEER